MLYMWIALMLILLIAEAATAQLVTVWFALGALTALLANIFGADEWLQTVLFVVVSIASLAATRPLVKKLAIRRIHPTNVDRNIGEVALVTQTIDNLEGKGLVKLNGIVWTARSADGSEIAEGRRVTVESIEGVKLMVRETPVDGQNPKAIHQNKIWEEEKC